MNLKHYSLAALAAIFALSACNNDITEVVNADSEYINSVKVTVDDFISETGTRTAYTVDAEGFHFQWATGDTLGIYPVGGDQVAFPISEGDGSATAQFDGGAWKLRSSYQYAAYYPFSAANYHLSETSLPVSYTGQTQNGNGSTAHLASYDYLACAATAPNGDGGIDMTMNHLGAFVRLQLTMPKADTFSSVVLESDGAKFVTAGIYDLSAATPAITSTETSSTYTIALSNVSTSAAGEVITVYAMVAPANLSAANITVTVHGAEQTTYVATVTGKNFQSGSAYNFAITSFPSGTNASGEDFNWVTCGHEYVDLGITDDSGNTIYWATCNLGADSPEDYGKYYAWGETKAFGEEDKTNLKNYSYTGSYYKTSSKWDTYKYCQSYMSMTKYCTSESYGPVDNLTTLELSDDAARANWGGLWRMPTDAELTKLRENCTWTWDSAKKGYTVTGTNGNSIFMPTAGTYSSDVLMNAGTYGYYWSSSLRGCDNAWSVLLYETFVKQSHDGRWACQSVRPVLQ